MTIVRAADIAPQDLRSLPIANLRQQIRRDREAGSNASLPQMPPKSRRRRVRPARGAADRL